MSANTNRKSLISKCHTIAGKLAANLKQGVALRWELAEALFDLRGTYAQGSDETAAFFATATTATKLDESVIRNLVAAVEVRRNLTKTQAAKVTAWPTDSVLVLKPAKGDESGNGKVGPAEVTRIIAKAEKAGTTNTKAIRGYKRDVVGTAKRTRGDDAEKTTKLAAEIEERVSKAVADGHSYVSMIVGAQMAQDNPGRDVAGAILFLSAQVTAPKSEPVAA